MSDSLFGPDIQRDASISNCGRYRWSLSREWDGDLLKPWLGWIMLNPSVADASIDDPTIRRCMSFAKLWGFSGIGVYNLFALRATEPRELYKAADPIGHGNDEMIVGLVGVCPAIVAAWGVHGQHRGRDKEVIKLIHDAGGALHCLGTTKDGHPKHPLYVPATEKLVPFLHTAKV